MNPTQSLRRPTFTVVVQSLLWLWLIGLSVFALRGHQAINDQADQQRLEGSTAVFQTGDQTRRVAIP